MLYLSNMSFFQKKHTDAGPPDPATDRIRIFSGQQSPVEFQVGPCFGFSGLQLAPQ
jgi:hypothetical protein